MLCISLCVIISVPRSWWSWIYIQSLSSCCISSCAAYTVVILLKEVCRLSQQLSFTYILVSLAVLYAFQTESKLLNALWMVHCLLAAPVSGFPGQVDASSIAVYYSEDSRPDFLGYAVANITWERPPGTPTLPPHPPYNRRGSSSLPDWLTRQHLVLLLLQGRSIFHPMRLLSPVKCKSVEEPISNMCSLALAE